MCTNLVKLTQNHFSPRVSLPVLRSHCWLCPGAGSTHFLHSQPSPVCPGRNGGAPAFLDTRDARRRKSETVKERGSVIILFIPGNFHHTQRHLYSTGIGWGYIYNMHSMIKDFLQMLVKIGPRHICKSWNIIQPLLSF